MLSLPSVIRCIFLTFAQAVFGVCANKRRFRHGRCRSRNARDGRRSSGHEKVTPTAGQALDVIAAEPANYGTPQEGLLVRIRSWSRSFFASGMDCFHFRSIRVLATGFLNYVWFVDKKYCL